jgi:hypothetical protein
MEKENFSTPENYLFFYLFFIGNKKNLLTKKESTQGMDLRKLRKGTKI